MTVSASTTAAIKADVAATTTANERAIILEQLVTIVYNDVVVNHTGGDGLDGRDGAERRLIGKVLSLAKDYCDGVLVDD